MRPNSKLRHAFRRCFTDGVSCRLWRPIINSWFQPFPDPKAFLVLDSCRATERNGNKISADVTDDANKND
jgi:hypothetical protein